ncbi:MAG: SUMF1/EgtB/PvdO family nonheme iron enzyme, partial [Kiritimatiellia bacterium]
HWAACRDSARAADLLILMGADVSATASNGITPLHWAAANNATNVLKTLIAQGSDIKTVTESGNTPLHWAVLKHSDDTAAFLAYMTVTRQMEMERKLKAVPDVSYDAGPEEAEPEKPPAQPLPPPRIASSGAVISGVSAGRKTLLVPIGLEQELVFAEVTEAGLWVGKYEITNGQYRRYRPKHNSMFYEEFTLNSDRQPAVYVSWQEAVAFSEWLNRNYSDRIPLGHEFRLPTEAEWMTFASCGENRKYPWGNDWPPEYGNYSDLFARARLSEWRGIKRYNDGHVVTCPVDKSGVNEWGIYGVGGNAWEWCRDWYGSERKYRVRKGGCWYFDREPLLSIKYRGFDRPDAHYDTIGFRLVVAPTEL